MAEELEVFRKALQNICTTRKLAAPEYMIVKLQGGFGATVNYDVGVAVADTPQKTEDSAKELAAFEALRDLGIDTLELLANAETAPEEKGGDCHFSYSNNERTGVRYFI